MKGGSRCLETESLNGCAFRADRKPTAQVYLVPRTPVPSGSDVLVGSVAREKVVRERGERCRRKDSRTRPGRNVSDSNGGELAGGDEMGWGRSLMGCERLRVSVSFHRALASRPRTPCHSGEEGATFTCGSANLQLTTN